MGSVGGSGQDSSKRSRSGRLLVVSGPSGVGKTTVVRALAARHPLHFSVSVTTRPPRLGERDGIDYRFVTETEFDEMRRRGELLEWAEYSGYRYGTPRAPVLAHLAAGEDVLLDIEVKGAMQVKAAMAEAVTVFLAPPSVAELERRLAGRGDTDPTQVSRRLIIARWQLEVAPRIFDHVVVNDDVETAVEQIVRILEHPEPRENPS